MPFISAAADNPFPDLSLLEQKLAPAKGPARRLAVRAAIEDHPRIAQRIEQLWGTSECEQYLNTLIIDNRGNRQGFPPRGIGRAPLPRAACARAGDPAGRGRRMGELRPGRRSALRAWRVRQALFSKLPAAATLLAFRFLSPGGSYYRP
jgi:hypothetical protein